MSTLRVGILAGEFLGLESGRQGGFGWAATSAAACFQRHPSADVEVCFLGAPSRGIPLRTSEVGGIPLLRHPESFAALAKLRRSGIQAMLTIDYRSNYRPYLLALPKTPVFVWSRDPRTPEDQRRIATLQIPGKEGEPPRAISLPHPPDLRRMARFSRLLRRPLLIASKTDGISLKVRDVYGIPGSGIVLPNPNIVARAPTVARTERPTFVYLGRLDPVKRPWLFFELARKVPEAMFLIMGQSHFSGPGTWSPVDVPDNLRLLGHVQGEEKLEVLASAWALVNTSIHEETPVSMFEALSCGTPVIDCLDTGAIASRFGKFVGRFDGSGMAAVEGLARAVRELVEAPEQGRVLGEAGREWVAREHNDQRFLRGFQQLCAASGLRPPAAS